MNNTPVLLVVAGPNGSGKTTIADFLMKNQSIEHFINADVIARGISAATGASSDITAGRIMLTQLKNAIEKQASIAFESTMAGKSWTHLLEQAKAHGYQLTICYTIVKTPDTAIRRIEKRVTEGGHHIPPETVRRRFGRSKTLFLSHYRKLADSWYLFDNSLKNAELIAFKEEHKDNEAILNNELYSYYMEL